MNQNVMIPVTLLDRIVDLLESFDANEHDPFILDDIGNVIWTLMIKKQRLVLRDALSNVARANDPDTKANARAFYLRQKEILAQMDDSYY